MPQGLKLACTGLISIFFVQNIAVKRLNFPKNDTLDVVLTSKLRRHDVVLLLFEGTKSKKRSAEQTLHKSKSPKKAKTGKEGKRAKKSKKDGPQVKRASSAYIHFTTDFRQKLKQKCEKSGDPLPKANEVAKMAGEQWKKLNDEERAPYNQLAQADKERYLKEVSKDCCAYSNRFRS